MNNEEDIIKIRKIKEIGETPFYFLKEVGSVLQGFNKSLRKMVFLFKTENGWSYYDKEINQVVKADRWKEDSVFMKGYWVKMSLYHKVHLQFLRPVSCTAWDKASKREYTAFAPEAIVTITDMAYKSLLEQTNGRNPNSLYRFVFVSRNIGGKTVSYIEKVIWVNPSL